MKKLMAMLICLIMLLSMTAVAEVNATLTLADGTAFGVQGGMTAANDVVVKVDTAAAGLGEIGLQFGAQTAYIAAQGMVLSLDYSEIVDLLGEQMSGIMAGSGMSTNQIPMEAIEGLAPIGQDLVSLMNIQSTETQMIFDMSCTAADLWDACGADVITWLNTYSADINAYLEATDAGMTVEQLVAALSDESNVEMIKGLDFAQNATLTIDQAAPAMAFDGSWTSEGRVVLAINFSASLAGIEFSATNAAGETVSFKIVVDELTENGGSFTVYANDEMVCNLALEINDAVVEPITDGSDAIPASALLKMLSQG